MLIPLVAMLMNAQPQLIDLDAEKHRQVVVDREPGQYLGHVTTVLLEDNRTMLATYPKGHGVGEIVMKRSTDRGLTWSERLPLPENWKTSQEVPTIYRTVDKKGKKRLVLWSGLYPARIAHSEDDGKTWTPLKPAGDWGGIVVMGSQVRLKNGDYLAMFHDDGRFFRKGGKADGIFRLYQTVSSDGGLTWGEPDTIWTGSDVHLCEPGMVRSPDGNQLLALLRENKRVKNSHVIASDDEGGSWSAPKEMHPALTGDRHTLQYNRDGRLVCVFRDMSEGPWKGDFVAWVGRYEDILAGRPGQYRVRLADNQDSWDSSYPGLELLPDGTFVATTYGYWTKGEKPYILSIRFKLSDLDQRARS